MTENDSETVVEVKRPVPMRYWSQYVRQRIRHNRNFIGCITGATGSGKSYAALSWAEELDPSFSVDRVVFTPKQFMELINNDTLQKGNVILFDEIGVAMNSKEHMSVVNRSLNFFMQTFRHRNWILLMTTPHIQFLDAGVRRLLHSHAETMGIDHKRKKNKLKMFSLSVGQYNGKIYRKYLRVILNHKYVPVHRVSFGLPSQALRDAYEDKKMAFTKALNQRIKDQVDRQEEKELGTGKRGKTVALTPVQEAVLDKVKGGLDLRKTAEALGYSEGRISHIKRSLEKKGFVFKPQRDERGGFYEIIPPKDTEVV